MLSVRVEVTPPVSTVDVVGRVVRWKAAQPKRMLASLATETEGWMQSSGRVMAIVSDGGTSKAAANCANCALYLGGSAPKQRCVLFQKGVVLAVGHCVSWSKKST